MAGTTETEIKPSGKAVGWNAELEKRLIMTILTKDNAELSVKGWKEIVEDMEQFGFTSMACK
jgi:hypothetical protein